MKSAGIIGATSGVRYVEHENSNAYRNYPFSEDAILVDDTGVTLATDVFVDAVLYPIVWNAAPIYLARMSFSQAAPEVEVSDGTVVLKGVVSGGAVELYDALGRHGGTLVCGPGWAREAGMARKRVFGPEAVFCPQACCPVVFRGVVGLSDTPDATGLGFNSEDRVWRTSRRSIVLSGDGVVTPVLAEIPGTDGDPGFELRFDVQFSPPSNPRNTINQIVLATVGATLFDVESAGNGGAVLSTPMLDREDVCWQAHKEDSIALVVDACEDDSAACVVPLVPNNNGVVEICPDDVGNISIMAENALGYKNALKVSTVEGGTMAQRPQVQKGMSEEEAFQEASKMLDRPISAGNGIRISIPGLNDGK